MFILVLKLLSSSTVNKGINRETSEGVSFFRITESVSCATLALSKQATYNLCSQYLDPTLTMLNKLKNTMTIVEGVYLQNSDMHSKDVQNYI